MDDLAPTHTSTRGKSMIPVVVGIVQIIIISITVTFVVVVVVNDAVFFPVIAAITALSTLVFLIISAIAISIVAITIIDGTNHPERKLWVFCAFGPVSWIMDICRPEGVIGLFYICSLRMADDIYSQDLLFCRW